MMNPLPLSDVLEAAAYALVNERCRDAYMHDMRGGLQALNSALELLARSAKTTGENVLVQKATELARRAMVNHEKSLIELLHYVTPHTEPAMPVDLGDVLHEVLRSLEHDALSRLIRLELRTDPGLFVVAQRHNCRLLMLGLGAMTIDALAPGDAIEITTARVGAHALIEFKSGMPCPPVRDPPNLWRDAQSTLQPYELLLALTQHWANANGGRIELLENSRLPNMLRIYYPTASPHS
jgi:hypothetical protein